MTCVRIGALLILGAAILVPMLFARAEYADVTINTRAESEGVAPVIYPHWFHRIRFQCSVCHVDLGIKMGAGTTGITMEKLIDGQYCGACHDGETAWSMDSCDLCHSGKLGLETGIKGGHETAGPGVY
jgi:c(7)-type cytochrome triheme protein